MQFVEIDLKEFTCKHTTRYIAKAVSRLPRSKACRRRQSMVYAFGLISLNSSVCSTKLSILTSSATCNQSFPIVWLAYSNSFLPTADSMLESGLKQSYGNAGKGSLRTKSMW